MNKFRCLSVLQFLLFIYFFIYPITASASENIPLRTTFMLFDFPYWSDNDMEPLFVDMKKVGIEAIIITSIGLIEKDVSKNPPTYTYHNSLTNTNSQLRIAIRLAKKYGIGIYFGTVGGYSVPTDFGYNYWSGSPDDPTSDKGRLMAFMDSQLNTLESISHSEGWSMVDNNFIRGFYNSQEISVTYAVDTNVTRFFSEYTQRLKQRYPLKTVFSSPWIEEDVTYNQAYNYFSLLYSQTGMDVIAPQDSIGSGLTRNMSTNEQHFRALRDAANAHNKTAWANIESFTMKSPTDLSYHPTNFTLLKTQIETVRPYISKYITWIYQHNLSDEPRLIGHQAWTNAYSIEQSIRRLELRYRYDDWYQFGSEKVRLAFYYGQNYVVKGTSMGTVGQQVPLQLSWMSSKDGSYITRNFSPTILMEDLQTVYIPISSITDVDITKPVAVKIITPTITPTPTTPCFSPVGYVDSITCGYFSGWAGDQDSLSTALSIHFYANAPYGSPGSLFIGSTTADIPADQAVCTAITGDSSLCAICNSDPVQAICRHRFSFATPTSLYDNVSHSIYAYAINVGCGGSNILIPGSPGDILCQTPTNTPTLSPSDYDGDGDIDFIDVIWLKNNWGSINQYNRIVRNF